ncbi:hypothetical protein CEXT_576201 [Caerostris extrusa]|uniref:Uncharacterized protein n=1 Tax=Caerostris extrusa TaxID=172846 RepID=A0AAV4QI47_CAEEX|nr:hypothetical protein CEXT_576201 [Caerostris extrusa]
MPQSFPLAPSVVWEKHVSNRSANAALRGNHLEMERSLSVPKLKIKRNFSGSNYTICPHYTENCYSVPGRLSLRGF